MARPKKSEAFERSEQINLRLTLDEKEALRQRAIACGLTQTDYARRVIFGVPVSFKQEADPKLIVALNRIGVNLNQMSRMFNSKAMPVPEDLEYALKTLNHLVDQLQWGYETQSCEDDKTPL
jgi:Bacterial mobilisation protein (MobC)